MTGNIYMEVSQNFFEVVQSMCVVLPWLHHRKRTWGVMPSDQQFLKKASVFYVSRHPSLHLVVMIPTYAEEVLQTEYHCDLKSYLQHFNRSLETLFSNISLFDTYRPNNPALDIKLFYSTIHIANSLIIRYNFKHSVPSRSIWPILQIHTSFPLHQALQANVFHRQLGMPNELPIWRFVLRIYIDSGRKTEYEFDRPFIFEPYGYTIFSCLLTLIH